MFLVLLFFIGLIFYLTKNTPEKQKGEIKSPSSQITPVERQNTAAPTDTGQEMATIQGSLSYPSEIIPEDMEVCAQDIDNSEIYCEFEKLESDRFDYGVGYRLQVPGGHYYVYAYIPERPEQKAYYNEFVECGLSANCPSHEKIVVEVESGELVTGINPQDWYNFGPQE